MPSGQKGGEGKKVEDLLSVALLAILAKVLTVISERRSFTVRKKKGSADSNSTLSGL